jgi:outer membrane usher protein
MGRILLLAVLAFAAAASARAAEMGGASVVSALGEPLLVEIEILALRPGDAHSLSARLATPGTFNAADIEYVPTLFDLRFGIETRGARNYVIVFTGKPIREPALRVLVELESSAGRTVRHYTLMIDPPGYRRRPPVAPRPVSDWNGLRLSRELGPAAEPEPGGTARAPSTSIGSPLRLERSLSVPPAREAAASRSAEPGAPLPMAVEVFINNARAGDWLVLDVDGALHATQEAFDAWRVMRPAGAPAFSYRGELWYPLGAVPGYEAQFDTPTQSLRLRFSSNAFAATRLSGPGDDRPAITPPLFSVFANYDLSYTHSETRGTQATKDLGALTEIGVSGGLGVLTTSGVGRNLAEDDALAARSFVRLETTFTRDFPQHNTTLRLGDSITRQGTWGRQVYFGGVQFGRNFALSPGFVTQPIPVISGQSTAPSTIELFINDSLRQTSTVPTGPFTIENYPLLTGTGQARIVVRDLLGRETVTVQNFFSSSYLLRQGLTDWTAQGGALRRNLGTESADYGEAFASGVYRYGLSNNLTLEAQAEASESVRGGGLGVSAGLFGQVLGQAAFAGSTTDSGEDGYLWMLGAEHLSLRHGFTLHAEAATREYRRIGQDDVFPTYNRQVLASYTYFSESFGHFGVAYGRVNLFDTGSVSTYSANYTVRIGERSSLTLSATRVHGVSDSSAIGFNLLIPLDARTTAAAVATRRENGTDAYVSASRSLGIESGFGWRALAGKRFDEGYGEAGLYYQGRRGFLSADAAASEDQQTVRLGAQGGLVAAGGSVFVSRKLLDSFALVEVPGYPDVGVGFQSTVLTRTDPNGKALVPQLAPYRRNAVRLDPSELPISAELDNIEIVVVPPARSGVRVAFPVRSGRGALITIHLDDGGVAPAGAEIELVGDPKEFFVARRGEAFVTGLQPKNTLRLKWGGASCSFDVELPPGDKDEIARLGPYVCAGVKR